jgi:hypothetical protein
MPALKVDDPRRLIRRLSIAFEFAMARRWKRPCVEANSQPSGTRATIGEMLPKDSEVSDDIGS